MNFNSHDLPEFAAQKSTLASLDLATQADNGKSVRTRLQFNDAIEVYFYPENKEQHDHHHEEDYDEDEDEEEEEDEV